MLPYFNIQINLTLWAFVLVSLDIFFILCYRRQEIVLNHHKILALIIFGGLLFLMVFSLLYTPSPEYSFTKTFLFFANILCFVYPLFIIELDFKFLSKLFFFIFLPIAIWFFVARYLYFSSFNVDNAVINESFYDIRGYYMGFGYGLSFLSLILVYLKKPFIYLALTLLTIIGLGARGALLFLILVLIIWKWKSIIGRILKTTISKRNLKRIALSLVLVVPIAIVFGKSIYNAIGLGLYRFKSLFHFSQDVSSIGRIERLEFAFNSIFGSLQTFLFGNGIGSFGIMFGGEDVREYPHNIFVEGWFEMGVVFFLLLILFLFLPYFLKRIQLYKMLALVLLLNYIKSGDLSGAWLLFLAYGILIFNPKIRDEIRT